MGKRGPRPSLRLWSLEPGAGPTTPARMLTALRRTPPPPRGMNDEAKRIWRRLAPVLARAQILTSLDLVALGVLCDLLMQLERAREMLVPGLLVRGRADGLVTNPAWRIYRDTALLVRAYCAEFGLTPSAREGLSLPVPLASPEQGQGS